MGVGKILGRVFPTLMLTVFLRTNVDASAVFVLPPISGPIVSATFSGDFAALTAHRRVAGVEVNSVSLVGADGFEIDLSGHLFGDTDALADAALIDQGLLETGIVSAPIDSAFFPALGEGFVGIRGTVTDTMDGLFAIDRLTLTIESSSGITQSLLDLNDGFGIGIPDGGILPSGLPSSVPVGASGTGFDETISSKTFFGVPEPSTAALVFVGLFVCLGFRRRSARSN